MANRSLCALAALFVLSTTLTTLACGQNTDDGAVYANRTEALSAAARLSDSGIASCEAITYMEGETVVALYVSGYDQDDDGLAVIPWNSANIYEANEDGESQYVCGDTTPISYVVIDSDDDIGADCDDGNAEIGEAGYATYPDLDMDGYGSGDATWVCEIADGDVTVDGDCDDGNAAINPAADEICDDVDNDCDELVDEGDDSIVYGESDWAWFDGDSDGYGAGEAEGQCDLEEFWVRNVEDCNGEDGGVNPAAEEACDAIDNDCDEEIDEGDVCGDPDDADGDGYMADTVEGGDDCNDSDASINPGADDVDNDGVDNDCNKMMNDVVCGAPIDGVDALSAELYVGDYSLLPDALDSTSVIGDGELCVESFPLVESHWLKVNAEVSGGAFWWAMLDADNVENITVAGVDVLGESRTYFTWYIGEVATGRDLLVLVPTLPTAFPAE